MLNCGVEQAMAKYKLLEIYLRLYMDRLRFFEMSRTVCINWSVSFQNLVNISLPSFCRCSGKSSFWSERHSSSFTV